MDLYIKGYKRYCSSEIDPHPFESFLLTTLRSMTNGVPGISMADAVVLTARAEQDERSRSWLYHGCLYHLYTVPMTCLKKIKFGYGWQTKYFLKNDILCKSSIRIVPYSVVGILSRKPVVSYFCSVSRNKWKAFRSYVWRGAVLICQ